MSREVSIKHTFNTLKVAEELVPDKINRNTYFGAVVIALVLCGVPALIYNRLPERLPLLWTLPWGEARLLPRVGIFGGGILTLIIVVVNVILGKSWVGGGSLVPRILSTSVLVVALALLIAMWGVLQSFFL